MCRQARRPLRREPCHHDWLLKPKKTFLLQIKSKKYFLTTSSRIQRTQKEIPQTRSSSRHSLESLGTLKITTFSPRHSVAGKENLFSFSHLSPQAGRLATARTSRGMQILEKTVAVIRDATAASCGAPICRFCKRGEIFSVLKNNLNP